jgi:hypothetical protein
MGFQALRQDAKALEAQPQRRQAFAAMAAPFGVLTVTRRHP